MKQKFLIVLSLLSILILSACGGADATPELSPEDTAATAMAEAWIAITQTAAALPTNTPIPPTFTPQPTNTAMPTIELLPTLPPAPVVVATATADCIAIPVPEPKGALVNVEIYNESQGSATVAFGMNSANDKNECFSYSLSLGRNDVYTGKVLAGCYWGIAWITGEEQSVARSGDLMCLSDPAFIHKIKITQETFTFK
ncbi:MAG: hypothetical protein J0M11_03435 [Anaerolineae bacterium]|nr:hypothetical protein [Anaerolineae bacterium]